MIYTVLTVWMVASYFAGTAMNALFTIDWLERHNAPIDRSFQLGPLSNFLRALDIANEHNVLPGALRWQKRFYLQSLTCIVLMLVAFGINHFVK